MPSKKQPSKEAQDRRKEHREEIVRRMDLNDSYLSDLQENLHLGEGIIGNAAYHTSVVTGQPILEVLATVRVFHVWLDKIWEIEQKKQEGALADHAENESEVEAVPDKLF